MPSNYPFPELLDGRRVAVLAILAAISITISAICLTATLDPEHVAPWAKTYMTPLLSLAITAAWSAYVASLIVRARARKKSKSSVTAHVYRWEPGKGIVGIVGDEPPFDPLAKDALETLLRGYGSTTPRLSPELDAAYAAMAQAFDALISAISVSDPTIIRAHAGDALQLIADAVPANRLHGLVISPADRPVLRLTRAIEQAIKQIRESLLVNFDPGIERAVADLTAAVARQQTQPASAEPSPAAG